MCTLPNVELSSEKNSSEDTQSTGRGLYVMTESREWRNFAWRRWAARCLDYQIGYLMMSFITRDDSIASLGAFFFDSLVFALKGTTPGKQMAGIGVCNQLGQRINGWKYFCRDCKILCTGLGMFMGWGMFIFMVFSILLSEFLKVREMSILFIPQLIQYARVSHGKMASYDRCSYRAYPLGGGKKYGILCVSYILLLSGLLMCLNRFSHTFFN